MEYDAETKWLAIAMSVIAVSAFTGLVWVSQIKSSESKAAMENGYIQQVDADTGQVIWVKDKE